MSPDRASPPWAVRSAALIRSNRPRGTSTTTASPVQRSSPRSPIVLPPSTKWQGALRAADRPPRAVYRADPVDDTYGTIDVKGTSDRRSARVRTRSDVALGAGAPMRAGRPSAGALERVGRAPARSSG